ncbi:MAG: alpha/beta hydrolase [Malacoplasma sp.]|nr:alpha/beta hydrolase [Malacoplasma sp.]MDE5952545.1 alpha/beta hydrolase [Malacoplasma sp.]MDE6645722.1 alpha/beta hydrolase [Malacoplasma sp.]MDE6894352.1 alpha/beta hydrolase [Malacoplasma sp.]
MKDFQLINENGYTFRYRKANNSSTKNILFVHGFAVTSEYHDDYVEKFFDEYNYYAIELPGHGYAKLKHVTQLDPIFYAKYVSDFIKLKGFEDLVLIGHSMGGGIVLMVTNLVPNQLKKAVVVTPMNSSVWFSFKGLNSLKLLPDSVEKNWKYKNILVHEPNKHYSGVEDQIIKKEIEYLSLHMKDFKILRKKMMSWKLHSELKNSEENNSVQTLLILGRHDKVISCNSTSKRFENLDNYQTVIFENSAHLPFMEETNDYVNLVLDFADNDAFDVSNYSQSEIVDESNTGQVNVEENQYEQAEQADQYEQDYQDTEVVIETDQYNQDNYIQQEEQNIDDSNNSTDGEQ